LIEGNRIAYDPGFEETEEELLVFPIISFHENACPVAEAPLDAGVVMRRTLRS
jgi:hypothetical protein